MATVSVQAQRPLLDAVQLSATVTTALPQVKPLGLGPTAQVQPQALGQAQAVDVHQPNPATTTMTTPAPMLFSGCVTVMTVHLPK